MDDKPKATDLLGIKSYGEALKIAVERSFDGASALLSRICLPAAEELGLWYKDKIRYRRLLSIIEILEKAEAKIGFVNEKLEIHPRIMHQVIEEGSWCEDGLLQDMWSGLLLASCSTNEPTDENLLFMNTLKNLTAVQAKVIQYICEQCVVRFHLGVFIDGSIVEAPPDKLSDITGLQDTQQIDSQLESLQAQNLLVNQLGGGGGFAIGIPIAIAYLKPSSFLLDMYARCQGFDGGLKEFYANKIVTTESDILFQKPVIINAGGA